MKSIAFLSTLMILIGEMTAGASQSSEAKEPPSFYFQLDEKRLSDSVDLYWKLDDLWLETFLELIPIEPVLEATGQMIKPSVGRISSPFSLSRVHPVFGQVRPHGGTDIAGHYGDLIRAADGGSVVYADEMYGYGNIVILNHGGGLTTFYAHQQKLAVRLGDVVYKGDIIGYVGSTGVSTGPHLHFEVRKGIERLDPYDYIVYTD